MSIKRHLHWLGIPAVFVLLITASCTFGQAVNNAEKRATADAILNDAIKLANQGTAQSVRSSLSKFEEVTVIYREIGEKKYEAYCLGLLGRAFSSLGERQNALERYNLALALIRQIGDKNEEAALLNNIGLLYSKGPKAIEHYNLALALTREVGNKRGEATTLSNIGLAYYYSRKKPKTLEYYFQALQLFESIGDKTWTAVMLFNIGEAYRNLFVTDKEKALAYYDRSIPLLGSVKDVSIRTTRLAAALANAGSLYLEKGEKKKALSYYLRALPLTRSARDQKGEQLLLNRIGEIYRLLGDMRSGLQYWKQILPLVRTAKDKPGEVLTLWAISGAFLQLGENQKGFDYARRALDANTSIMGRSRGASSAYEALILANFMDYWESRGMTRLAIFYGKKGLDRLRESSLRVGATDNLISKSIQKQFRPFYRKLIELLIDEGQYGEAVQILNFFQDEQVYDFDRSSSSDPRRLDFSSRESDYSRRYDTGRSKIESRRARIATLRRKIGARQPSDLESGRLRSLESDLDAAIDDFLAALPDEKSDFTKAPDAGNKVGPIKEVAGLKSALKELSVSTGKKAAAIYTLVGESRFHILLLTPDREINHFESSIDSAELNTKVSKFYALLQSPTFDPRPLGMELNDIILKPVEEELKRQNIKTVMWQLAGKLRYIPVSALFDGRKYLAEKYQTVMFSRSATANILRDVRPNWSGTGLGSSEAHTVEPENGVRKIALSALPGVTNELNSIFQKKGPLEGEILSNKQFTKESFYNAMKKRRPVVHIASHFVFRPGDDSRTFLLLGDGNILTLSEMKTKTKLFEGVDLLTLSACETAATQPGAFGLEIDGFAELAQRLGAGAVMATLWQVSDASTPWLMREFYSTRQQSPGVTKAEALQKAQLALLNGTAKTKPLPDAEKSSSGSNIKIVIVPKGEAKENPETRGGDQIFLDEDEAKRYEFDENRPFAHPYYWSPFVLYGNWR